MASGAGTMPEPARDLDVDPMDPRRRQARRPGSGPAGHQAYGAPPRPDRRTNSERAVAVAPARSAGRRSTRARRSAWTPPDPASSSALDVGRERRSRARRSPVLVGRPHRVDPADVGRGGPTSSTRASCTSGRPRPERPASATDRPDAPGDRGGVTSGAISAQAGWSGRGRRRASLRGTRRGRRGRARRAASDGRDADGRAPTAWRVSHGLTIATASPSASATTTDADHDRVDAAAPRAERDRDRSRRSPGHLAIGDRSPG